MRVRATILFMSEPTACVDGQQAMLFRFDDGSAFAYARRGRWIRCSDGRPWADMSRDALISARSGECLAIRVGKIFYDASSHEPLYYEVPQDR